MNTQKEQFNKKVKEVLDKATGWHDGSEDKFVIISRLVMMARNGEFPAGLDMVDYIAETIMIVQEEWED